MAEHAAARGFEYDLVVCLRLDQALHNSLPGTLMQVHERHRNVMQVHEALLMFPGCLTDTVLRVLHHGCVERSRAWDFGAHCWDDLRSVLQAGDLRMIELLNYQVGGSLALRPSFQRTLTTGNGWGGCATRHCQRNEQAYVVGGKPVVPIDCATENEAKYEFIGHTPPKPRFWVRLESLTRPKKHARCCYLTAAVYLLLWSGCYGLAAIVQFGHKLLRSQTACACRRCSPASRWRPGTTARTPSR